MSIDPLIDGLITGGRVATGATGALCLSEDEFGGVCVLSGS